MSIDVLIVTDSVTLLLTVESCRQTEKERMPMDINKNIGKMVMEGKRKTGTIIMEMVTGTDHPYG